MKTFSMMIPSRFSTLASPRLFALASALLLVGCDEGDGTDTDEPGPTTDVAEDGESGGNTGNTEDATGDETTAGDGEEGESGAEGEESTGDLPEFDYLEDIQPLWVKSCFCHLTDMPGGMLDLNESKSYDALVDVDSGQASDLKIVAPGDPEASYLWHKLQDTHKDVGGSGTKMPPENSAIDPTDDELDLIRDWIAAGAPK